MYYGTSAAVYLVNYLTNVVVRAESLKSKKWAGIYLDDLIQETTDENFKNAILEHGLILSEAKSQSGHYVVFLGLEIDGKNKTIRVSEDTYNKFRNLISQTTMYKSDDSKYMLFTDFEKAMGLICRLTKSSIHGFTKSHHLMARLGEAMNNSNQLVELKQKEQAELKFWTESRHTLKMAQFARGAGSLQISTKSFEKQQKIQKLETPITSDSSGSYWGFKIAILGLLICKCGEIPRKYTDTGIAVKEGVAFKNLCEELVKVKMKKPEIEGMHIAVGLDSANLNANFTRRRAKNELMNEILSDIFSILEQANLSVSTYWISTDVMNSQGSDKISRRDYSEFENNLAVSEIGANFVKEKYGNFKCDVFGAPSNILNAEFYCSHLDIEDDPKNMRMSPLEFLASETLKKRLWVMPPKHLVRETLQLLQQIDWKTLKKVQVLLLVQDIFVDEVRAVFMKKTGISEIISSRFHKSGDGAKRLNRNARNDYVLIEINSTNK